VRVVEDLVSSPVRTRWVATSPSLEDTARGRSLADEIDRRGITRRAVDDRQLRELAATDTPQGVVAVADIPAADSDSVLMPPGRALVLVLDAVQDPGNFGALVRSAEALGAKAVVALPGTVDPWNPKSVRAAAGSSFRLPILTMGWEAAVDALRGGAYRIVGADSRGRSVREVEGERIALVLGNEGAGLSQQVRDLADDLAAVPLRGRAESLNVAAAAAILLYELSKPA
jgi:TrmH family RNA methyltransferase